MHKLRTLHLFAGAGGGILGDLLLGHQCVCAVEINTYCQQVLAARQENGALPWFPIFADVQEFDGKPWRGVVDCIAGGFPCQDISAAGKGEGIEGERSGLWREFARIVGEVRPRHVFVENSPMLTSRGLGRVLGDLAEMGFDARWGCISAADTGAPHKRDRIWIMAHADDVGPQGRGEGPVHGVAGVQGKPFGSGEDLFRGWTDEPDVGRVADGVPARMDRLKAIGNAQVPRVAAAAFALLGEE